jgi:hypothetical protein
MKIQTSPTGTGEIRDANSWLRVTGWTQYSYRPLLEYMDADSVAKHLQPWQQILAFIALTQVPHTEKSPPYGMTPRQRKKWRQLWQMATTHSPAEEDSG